MPYIAVRKQQMVNTKRQTMLQKTKKKTYNKNQLFAGK
jgi:hypothetical protein